MKTKYFIVALFSIFASPCEMKEGSSIELVGSTLAYAGQVQVSINGSKESICDAGWDRNDAQVVCRELGYSEAEAAISGEAFGHAPRQAAAIEFNCRGNEPSLSKCNKYKSTKTRCRQNKVNVAAVLCKPNDLIPVFIMITLVGCLALTSIIILIVTYKSMRRRKRRLPATDIKIVVSNPNNEEGIEKTSTVEGERGINEIKNAASSSDLSYLEESMPRGVEALSNDQDKEDDSDDQKDEVQRSVTDPEFIESISSVETHNRDNDEPAVRYKGSRKGRYMSLLKGSRVFLQFYENLLKKNRFREAATDVDFPEDYYSSYKCNKDWLDKDVYDITDIDSSSTDEYHEIYLEKVKEKVDKDALEYTPMLSFSHMQFQEVATEKEGSHDEYLDILAPNDLSKERTPRDSDYLDPVETTLPAFPATSDDEASCPYDAELPRPPSELLTSTCTDSDRNDERTNGSPANKLGLINQGCKCKNDLMCKNCLDIHFVANHTKLDLERIPKTKSRCSKEEESDFEYMPMDLCQTEKKGAEVEEKIRRNSANYAIPLKRIKEDKRNQSSFPEELNKTLLNLKNVKEPNNNKMNDFAIKSEGKEEAKKEKHYKMSPSPRNARKAIENKLPKENSGHLEKIKPKLSPKLSFSKSKNYFENNMTASQNQTKKMGDFSKRLFKSEEKESKLETLNLTDDDARKARSESCPVEGNSGKPSTTFLKDLEYALKANGSREGIENISGQKQEDIEMEMENEYELDYENIHSPTDSKYENDDFYSGSRSGSRPGSDEYDYVHEKQRSSLHFYEAVSKQSDEFEEDEYENI